MVGEQARRVYLDASALVKLLTTEPESDLLRDMLSGASSPISSRIAVVEVGRAAARQDELPTENQVDALLAGLLLIELDESVARAASSVSPPSLRTLDAIHLASALAVREELEALVTYDQRLADAARVAGLTVMAPR